MSIQALVRAGRLHRIGQELVDPDEDEICEVYGTDEFVRWRDDALPYLEGSSHAEIWPDEEVDDFLRRFQLGKPVTHMARLSPTKHGVWEVKLQSARLFGWFAEPGVLILSGGTELADVKKASGRGYNHHFEQARAQRKELGLDYVPGDITATLPPAKRET